MSIEHSTKLIKEIADRKEADEYFEGLLKDPKMRADMERVEQPTKWDDLTSDMGTAPQDPTTSELENER